MALRPQTAVLLGVPAIYVAGFLSWANYTNSLGLGWLPLGIPQLAAIGTLTLTFACFLAIFDVLPSMMVGALFEGTSGLMEKEARVVQACLIGFAPWFAARMFTATFGLMTMGHADPSQILSPFAAVFSGVALAFLRLFHASPGVKLGEQAKRRSEQENPYARLVEDDTGPDSLSWVFSLLTWGLIAAAIVGGAVGQVHTEFGGGAPRSAFLDLDPTQVNEAWHPYLFNETADLNATVARTVEVQVHHRNADFILFRTAAEPDRGDRLFDISKDAVKGIVWLS